MITVKFWVYNANCGDGSNTLYFFDTEEAAETYAEYDDERNCEDIKKYTLLFNDDGSLHKPDNHIGWRINPIRD